MTPETLSAIAGLALSLAFSYTPGLAPRFDALDPTAKRLVMLGLLLVVAVGAFGLSCASVIVVVVCDKPSAIGLLQVFIAALVANQSAYQVSPSRDRLASILRGKAE